MNRPMDICICSTGKASLKIYNGIWALGGSGIVKVHKRFAIDLLVQGREEISYVLTLHQ